MDDEQRGLTLPWAALSIALGVLAMGSLGTLAVVTSIKDVDVLSTVALALAVLSFAAQLIVTMAQSQQASQLNADTKSALSDMRATTGSLLTNQRDQFNTVLEAALRQAIPAAVRDVSAEAENESEERDTEQAVELESALLQRLDEALAGRPVEVRGHRMKVPVNLVVANQFNKVLGTYPDRDKGEPLVQELADAPPKVVSALSRLAADTAKGMSEDGSVTYTRREGATLSEHQGLGALVQRGWAAILSEPEPGKAGPVKYRLTPTGIIAARLLRGTGDLPEWALALNESRADATGAAGRS